MGWVQQVTDDISHAIGADTSSGFIGHIGDVIQNDPIAQAVVVGGLLIATGGASAIWDAATGLVAGTDAVATSLAAAEAAPAAAEALLPIITEGAAAAAAPTAVTSGLSGLSALAATPVGTTGFTLGDIYSSAKLANAVAKGDVAGLVTSAMDLVPTGLDFAGVPLKDIGTAAQTANAVSKGNTLGAIGGALNLAGSPDIGSLSSKDVMGTLQTANAIANKNPIGALTGALDLANINNIDGFSTKDVSTALKTANAVNNNNLAGIFSGATNLAGINDIGGLSTKDITTGLGLLAPATTKSVAPTSSLASVFANASPTTTTTTPTTSPTSATTTATNPANAMSLAAFGLPETKAMVMGEMGKPVTGYDEKLKQLAIAEDPLLAINSAPVYDTNVQKMANAPFYQNTAYSPFGFTDPTALFAAKGGSIQRFDEGGTAISADDITKMFKPIANIDTGLDKLPKIGALARNTNMGSSTPYKILPQLAAALKNRGITMAEGGRPDDQHHPHYDGTPVFRTGGLEGLGGKYVEGKGDGTSDDITAMLANGEYVFSADVVSALGNGSNKAGAQQLDHMTQAIRARARSAPPDKLPPDAKSPLEYLKSSKGKKHG